MKLCKATYFSLFFLLCFSASFGAASLQNLRKGIHKNAPLADKQQTLTAASPTTDSGSCLLFETNEDETEKSLSVQFFLLAFYHSYFHTAGIQPLVPKVFTPRQQYATPLYISMCNFRI